MLADLFAQGVIEGRQINGGDGGGGGGKTFSLARTLSFGFFSGAYLGCGQHFVYNVAFTRLFGSSQSLGTGAKKVAADAIVHVPFICEISLAPSNPHSRAARGTVVAHHQSAIGRVSCAPRR